MAENVARLLEVRAREAGPRPALVWPGGGSLTYAALDARAAGFARFLAMAGVSAGDRVAIEIPNRWPFVVALFGALRLGATAVPVDPRLTPSEAQAILADVRPRLVARDVVGDEASWPAVAEAGAPALILYTSGSTGQPKGAVLSHPAVAWALRSWVGDIMALTCEDVVLAVLPLSHSYGINGALLAPLIAGATIVVLERFAPETVLAAIREHAVTVFPGVATMFRRLLDSGLDLGDAGKLRIALSGAAPCPWELAHEWRERTGVRMLRGYGMTELFRPISYLAGDPTDRPDAIGRPVPGVDLRVVDEHGRTLPDGESGELTIRTPAAMDGYLAAPDATAAVLRDGWFSTGDLATILPGGLVRIDGRKRERILRGGYSVFPSEVEAVVLAHPAVKEAAVVGVPHPELGEEVAAFVVAREGTTVEGDELIAYCRARLAAFKYPRYLRVLDQLPRSATGKVLKARLSLSKEEGER